MVAVLFNKPGKMVGEKMSRKSLLKNMRLLRKEDIRPFAMDAPPKMPECILKKPRKLQVQNQLLDQSMLKCSQEDFLASNLPDEAVTFWPVH